MKHNFYLQGKAIGKYKISKKNLNDFNNKYEKAKKNLVSYGPRLAGRLDSELDLMPIIQGTLAFKSITECMKHYIGSLSKFRLLKPGLHDLEIIGCWMNDMVAGEYNPPHTHHNNTGWSTVLFLKVPEFINDARDPHKFKDGKLVFVAPDGISCEYYDPIVGDFYIFSANHMHCVLPFKTKKPNEIRRSMSFNFIIKENKDAVKRV